MTSASATVKVSPPRYGLADDVKRPYTAGATAADFKQRRGGIYAHVTARQLQRLSRSQTTTRRRRRHKAAASASTTSSNVVPAVPTTELQHNVDDVTTRRQLQIRRRLVQSAALFRLPRTARSDSTSAGR